MRFKYDEEIGDYVVVEKCKGCPIADPTPYNCVLCKGEESWELSYEFWFEEERFNPTDYTAKHRKFLELLRQNKSPKLSDETLKKLEKIGYRLIPSRR
ncbi:MAG: hypothetical protein ACTSX6_10560 [Candidatus Heimdallarchaeaceae archaeon]